MKILKKAKLLPIGCRRCGCVYQPKMRNLKVSKATEIKDEVRCPSCNTVNKANFEMPTESEINNEQR